MKQLINKIDDVRSLQLFQVMRYGSIILINILLAKSGLDTDEIGIYETLIFIGTGVSFFWVSGLLRGILPCYPSFSSSDKKAFIFNVFLFFCLISFLVAGGIFLFEGVIIRFMTDYESLPHFHLLCWFLLINTPTYLVEYIYLLNKQPKKIVAFGFFAFTTQILVVVLPIYLGYSFEESFKGLVILASLKLLWTIGLLIKEAHFKFKPALLGDYLWISFPLILNMLIAGGVEYIDGIIVHRHFDESAFAVFRYGAREFPLALALSSALSVALIPLVAQNLKKGLAEIKAKSKELMHILFPMSIALMLLSPVLFPIVFNPKFADSAIIFNIYLLLLSARMLFPQTIVIAFKRTQIVLWISLLELVINVGLSLLFVQIWGLAGIAYASVIAYLTDKLLLAVYLKIKLKININQYIHVPLYLSYSGVLILAFWISTFYH